ncbi:hypothetical protein ABID16_002507 [Rhizobium aquaticum]|uniref:TRAP C4-dicarboxylate transport system permease DctM subunit domain-containing protein n=1 Tax=Rhizobium aquaticum TaxID=1549636 RepID=A0ABV2J0B7_9HYPH
MINRLDERRRFAFILFGLSAGAFFTGTIAALGANFVWHMYSVSSISPDLELPMWIVYLAIPQVLGEWMVNSGLNWWMFLNAVNLLLLAAGNFMEPSSIVLIMAPILFPVAIKLGIDPVHFGIMIVVNRLRLFLGGF